VQGYLIGRPSDIEQLRHFTHGIAAAKDTGLGHEADPEAQRLAG